MMPFVTVALPHEDVREGRLTMEVFAANLWEVFKGRAPAEYRDPDIFFRKTELTLGLKNLIEVVKKRLEGTKGDPVIQLQTPFGGGKTHALITLYHKAREWGSKVVVIDGAAFDPKEVTIWEEIERQLTGKKKTLEGRTSPGREKVRRLFEANQPVLILMDELLQYVTKAAGIKVGDSSLASQVLAFMQELTEAVSILDRSVLVFSLPSSLLERYDESAERFFHQLQKIAGRTEKIYAPVQEEEVPSIVRRRLFSEIKEAEVKRIVEEFVDYAAKEKILPEGMEKSDYRERFLKSYPFQPEVIDTLYKRWGSFPTFQRTRGVLRLLALVTYSLKDSRNSYIRLADFDLANQEIRRELLVHIGQQFDSVINQDITSPESASKKANRALGDTYAPFSFGERAATSIFMYSFTAGAEKGATINEIKRSSADTRIASSVIADAVDKLDESAFYLWKEKGKYFFMVQPNLNRIHLSKMESINGSELREEEYSLLRSHLKEEHFRIYIWPSSSRDVPDTTELKLVIMQNHSKCNDFLERCGERPRIHRNTLIFLCPAEAERANFETSLRKKMAWQRIDEDPTLNLAPEQKKMVSEKLKNSKEEVVERLRELYSIVLVPSKDGFKEVSLGRPTYGVQVNFDGEVYERLRAEGEIVEKISPVVIREKFLKANNSVETANILNSFLNTPGENRITSIALLKESIREGVKQGLFGLGLMDGNAPKVRFFKEDCLPELVDGEVIIIEKLCNLQLSDKGEILERVESSPEVIDEKIPKRSEGPEVNRYKCIRLKLMVPPGKLSDVVRIINYLKSKFRQVDVWVELSSKEGEISDSEFDDKILEALQQADIKIEYVSKL